MTTPAPLSREVALKIGRWLVSKSRNEEAIALFCAGAVAGENDEAGQQLLAEALRLGPDSVVAKAAFERMEGVAPSADPTVLDAVIARFSEEEIGKLQKEMSRPQFMRAQVGFNNNLKYKGVEFHVQTEDSGLKLPHVITHLFADGGRIIKSHKRSYADEVDRADVGPWVRGLMKAQHMEMILALREGRFDAIIAGKERGGMQVLTEAPQVDMQQVARKPKEPEPEAEPKAPSLVPPPPEKPHAPVTQEGEIRFHLVVQRSLSGGPERYEPRGDHVLVGREGAIPLEGEKYCHPCEAMFHYRDDEIWLEDLEGGNGVFIRIRKPVELEIDDEFIVGDQLLRVEKNPVRDDDPDQGPTYFWALPARPSAFRVVQILVGGARGECRMAEGTTLQIGKTAGDLTFPKDPIVADPHCWVEEQAGVIVLTDLGSRTGVFVRTRGEQRVFHGDELIVGRTRLRLELPGYSLRK